MDGSVGHMGAVTKRWLVSVVLAIAVRPSLWGVASRQLFVLAAPGWWRRSPFLPVPDPAYLRFRMVTAYGGTGESVPRVDDVVTYLRWCRDRRHG